jgi:4-hydroxy-2-oxoheptanedioate aldolase
MSGEQAKKRLAQGFDSVSICTDTDSLIREFTRQLEAVKQ